MSYQPQPGDLCWLDKGTPHQKTVWIILDAKNFKMYVVEDDLHKQFMVSKTRIKLYTK